MKSQLLLAAGCLAWAAVCGADNAPIVGHPGPRQISTAPDFPVASAPIEEVVTIRGVLRVATDESGGITGIQVLTAAGGEYNLKIEPKNLLYAKYKDMQVVATGIVADEAGVLWMDVRSCDPIAE